jgi:metallo-beta-lactamase superfamily protein
MASHWRAKMAVLVGAFVALEACTRSFVPHGPVPLAVDYARNDETTYLQWLGTSSWVMSRGHDVAILDPFFSRPSFGEMALSLLKLSNDFGYRRDRIEDVLPALPADTKFVLISHAHYDHLMDVPYYLKRTQGRGVTYVGSRTTRLLLKSFGPAEMRFFEVPLDPCSGSSTPCLWPSIVNGGIAVRGFASDHAPHIFGIEFMHSQGDITEQREIPKSAGEYVDGTTLVYLIDFRDSSQKVTFRIFATGTVNSQDGAQALKKAEKDIKEYSTDVAILCVPGWDQVAGYPESVLSVLRHLDDNGQWQIGPRHVVLSHYDNFWAPYKNREDPKDKMDFIIRANYPGFVKKLKTLNKDGGYRFELHQPRTGECIPFPPTSPSLPCQR